MLLTSVASLALGLNLGFAPKGVSAPKRIEIVSSTLQFNSVSCDIATPSIGKDNVYGAAVLIDRNPALPGVVTTFDIPKLRGFKPGDKQKAIQAFHTFPPSAKDPLDYLLVTMLAESDLGIDQKVRTAFKNSIKSEVMILFKNLDRTKMGDAVKELVSRARRAVSNASRFEDLIGIGTAAFQQSQFDGLKVQGSAGAFFQFEVKIGAAANKAPQYRVQYEVRRKN